MFLKSLTISSNTKIIRKIDFRKGINLIVDETPTNEIDKKKTGNNVGKTTVLRLIDFCLGGEAKKIYTNPDNKKEIYKIVKNFLINKKVLIQLVLTKNLDDENAEKIIIERNFLTRKRTKVIRKINGKNFTEEDFEKELLRLIYPEHLFMKPSFRQIISHNIRYEETSTLKTLNTHTRPTEYETLYLFLLNCGFEKGEEKQEILNKIKEEIKFRNRLEKEQNKAERILFLINREINKLNEKKSSLNINKNFEKDLEKLNQLKYKINLITSKINHLNIRKNLIYEAKDDLNADISNIDLEQLRLIYQQANNYIKNLQKSFDNLLDYHNKMIIEKVKFITKELPELEEKIIFKNQLLKDLLEEELKLSKIIAKSDSFKELEIIIKELNEKFRKKGKYEKAIKQLNEIETNINLYTKFLNKIDNKLFSDEFKKILDKQIDNFNTKFYYISNQLYDEKYLLSYKIKAPTKNNKEKVYEFTTFKDYDPNISSGKRQGEIASFDIAYILFARDNKISCLNFLLNDKRELMHGNQLISIAKLVKENDIQFVASILKDKLPEELNNENYFIIQLSSLDKLFRIK